MTTEPESGGTKTRLERTYATTPEELWALWTTASGIESWWAPDGFTVTVDKIDLRPGGELVYTMTATAPEQIAFMESVGMPLTTESRKTFTEIAASTHIAYSSLADFIPGVEPYEFLTVVDLEATESDVNIVMTVDAMHDETWTERLLAGRANELDNLAAVIERRRTAS
jgi:uncharacterized protein YndB with AHSA1/START domain